MFQRGSILALFSLAVIAIVFVMPYHPIASLLGQTSTGSFLCGNGIVNENEQCDDGNALAGDGCSTQCTNECVYGSVCRSNTCIYLSSCSSTGAVLEDLSFNCDSDLTCGGTDDTFAGVTAAEQQYQCCEGACRAVGTMTDGFCASPAYTAKVCTQNCGSEDVHTECINDQCRQVAGKGSDACADDSECVSESHGVCYGNACIQEPGIGADQCDIDADCSKTSHLGCIEDQCVVIIGKGKDACDECNGLPVQTVSTEVSSVSSVSNIAYALSSVSSVTVQTTAAASSVKTSAAATTSATVVASSSLVSSSIPPIPSIPSSSSLSSRKEPTTQTQLSSLSSAVSAKSVTSAFIAKKSSVSSSSLSLKVHLAASTSVCGNGVLEVKEECDDSNRRDDDGCSANCLSEIGVCGDGKVQTLLGEQCEQKTHNIKLPYSCLDCRFLSPTCGDGTVDGGEECDDAEDNSLEPDGQCRPDCSLSRCGDAILDTAEECDDGNRISGDGCDRHCIAEEVEESDTSSGVTITFNQQPQTPTQKSIQSMFSLPQFPNMQANITTQQVPTAQLRPLIQGKAPIGDTGPAAVIVVASGIAGGLGWMRRKRRK